MRTLSSAAQDRLLVPLTGRHPAVLNRRDGLAWQALPSSAQAYVACVVAIGGVLMLGFSPGAVTEPLLFLCLLVVSGLTSTWKVTLPLGLSSGSTLSVSYAADLLALLLLGPQQAMIIAAAGVWTQCTFGAREPYPAYRTVFSIAAEAITIQATALAYAYLGGAPHPADLVATAKPVVGAITAYFIVNTGLVATAIALSTRRRIWTVWRDNFLWSASSFMVAGAAGAVAAMVIEGGHHWLAMLMLAPVYLTYRTYRVFLGRIEDERRHAEETEKLHGEAIEALLQARRAEQALADEKERLAVTLRSIGDGVITTDLAGNVMLINYVAESLTGWTQAESVGRPLDMIYRTFDPDTRAPGDSPLASNRHRDQPGRVRCSVLVARDLTERPIEEIGAPLQDADGATIGMVLAFRDITDALKAREERARAGRAASLGLLAWGIARDFNEILMSIMGSVSMARVTSRGSASARALTEAEEACLRARQLTWRLLTFARGGVPVKKTVSIARVVRDTARLAVRGTNVSCTFDIAPDLWAVSADEGQLVQIIHDLVVNAQQAMPHGGLVEVRAENVSESGGRWEHALKVEPGRYVRISVVDMGVGIPAELFGRIFDPYFSTKLNSSGLGLATSHSIVKNHGGFMFVESKLGTGTKMSFCLPASTTCELPSDEPIPNRSEATLGIQPMEDETSIRAKPLTLAELSSTLPYVVGTGTWKVH